MKVFARPLCDALYLILSHALMVFRSVQASMSSLGLQAILYYLTDTVADREIIFHEEGQPEIICSFLFFRS